MVGLNNPVVPYEDGTAHGLVITDGFGNHSAYKNGLREQRDVPVTPLDYFQYRILGRDTRFQRNDYLFYALFKFEYLLVKSTIIACGRKIVSKHGMVDDIHLYLKNLRGSAAYWKTAHNELIGQIRCLGLTHYFLTFSCNDLNWLDMRKALLIDPNELDIYATQHLVEMHAVVVSRHYMIRVSVLVTFMLNNK
ncbi:helitron_like_N domain-containing protein [Caerostris darwini]|uniref:Helitron_like_N domain-containing protein n=1 Tax=Caerostris darwini TaxID=1538125 RepID=A0AAV4T530_9ARAC|nr:helitron_like_N domain-containing protein [Caerostris darwini]